MDLLRRDYKLLVEERKNCTACTQHLTNPSKVDGGAFDSNHIGPYSRWQGNLYAPPFLIVGKDFADVGTFVKVKGWPGNVDDVRTNKRLIELVKAAGINIEPPRRDVPDDKLFFTNAVLCLKQGSMQSPVPPQCFKECGTFLRRTIELTKPRAVVTLGKHALNATLTCFGRLPHFGKISCLIEDAPVSLSCASALFPMYHPSPRVESTRSLIKQKSDWERLGIWLNTL